MIVEENQQRSFCDRIDKRIRLRSLPAPIVVHSYVKGDDKCNYELYMVELLNSSGWMKARFSKPFVHQKDQSHGQCDAYSGEYGIDFKLAAATSRIRAKSLLSDQIHIISKGAYVTAQAEKRVL